MPRYAFAMHVTEQNKDPRMSEYKPVIYMYIALIPTHKPWIKHYQIIPITENTLPDEIKFLRSKGKTSQLQWTLFSPSDCAFVFLTEAKLL